MYEKCISLNGTYHDKLHKLFYRKTIRKQEGIFYPRAVFFFVQAETLYWLCSMGDDILRRFPPGGTVWPGPFSGGSLHYNMGVSGCEASVLPLGYSARFIVMACGGTSIISGFTSSDQETFCRHQLSFDLYHQKVKITRTDQIHNSYKGESRSLIQIHNSRVGHTEVGS